MAMCWFEINHFVAHYLYFKSKAIKIMKNNKSENALEMVQK